MTHNERVLGLLSDGKPHTHHEGYALGVILHSRVADLRKRGHVIRAWREDDTYFYQLDSTPLTKVDGDDNRIPHGDAHQGVAGSSAGPSSTSVSRAVEPPPVACRQSGSFPPFDPESDRSAQLTFEVAA